MPLGMFREVFIMMNIKRKILLLVFAGLASATSLYAAGVGTTAAQFLKIGVGARAVAMGGAFSAVADNIDAIYWNPAGLSRLEKREFTASHAEMFESTRLDFLAYAHPTSQGTFARSAASANAADSISTATRPPIWPSRVSWLR